MIVNWPLLLLSVILLAWAMGAFDGDDPTSPA